MIGALTMRHALGPVPLGGAARGDRRRVPHVLQNQRAVERAEPASCTTGRTNELYNGPAAIREAAELTRAGAQRTAAGIRRDPAPHRSPSLSLAL